MRTGSFFEKSKLPLAKLILLMYLWGFDVPAFVQAKLFGVSERVTYQWNQYMRDVASTWLIEINQC